MIKYIFLSCFLLALLSFAQKGELKTAAQLDTIVLKSRIINADSLMQLVRENWKENHDVTGYELDFEYIEDERVISDDAVIRQLKTRGVTKKQIQLTNQRLEVLSAHFSKNPYRVYKTNSGKVVLKENWVPVIHVNDAVNYKPIKGFTTDDQLLEMGWNALGSEIDASSVYKIKSGWFTVASSTALVVDTATTREITTDKGKKIQITTDYRRNLGNQLAHLITAKDYTTVTESDWDFIRLKDAYNYQIIEYVQNDTLDYYKVKFIPDHRKSKFEGIIKVDAQDYALLDIDYSYAPGKHGQKVNLKWLLGVKFNENVFKRKVLFKKSELGMYYPVKIERITKSEMYVNRPFQFIENDTKDKRKFNFKAQGIVQQSYQVKITGIRSFDEELKGTQISGPKKYTIKELK